MRILLIFSIYIVIVYSIDSTVFSSSLKSCQDQCANGNLAFPLRRGEYSWSPEEYEACGSTCRISSCQQGCQDLETLESQSVARCTQDGINFDSCIQGCRAVEQTILSHIQDLLNKVTVSISIADEGAKLVWQFPENTSNAVQEIAVSDMLWYTQIHSLDKKTGWTAYAMSSSPFRNGSQTSEIIIGSDHTGTIEVRLAISYRSRLIVSRPVSYQLPPPLISPLKVVAQLQLASDKVAICWSGGRQEKFTIAVAALDGNILQTIETSKTCYLIKELPAENCCRATISETSSDETSSVDVVLSFQSHQEELDLLGDDVTPLLVFTNGSNLLQLQNVDDYILSEEPEIIPFELSEEDSIRSLCPISSSEIIVGTSKGMLWRLSIDNNSTDVEDGPVMLRPASDDVIDGLSYDAINGFVYAVLKEKGILRCSVTEPNYCTIYAHFDSLNPIRQLSIDYINGYLYFLCADRIVYRSPLFPFKTTETHTLQNIKMVNDLPPVVAIDISMNDFQLIASLKNGSLFAVDLISLRVSSLRTGEYSEIEKIRISNGRMFWTREKCGDTAMDEVCFYSEDTLHKESDSDAGYSRYLYSGTILDLCFLQLTTDLYSVLPPRDTAFISSDVDGRVSWKTPKQLPFQPSEWRNLTYRVEITSGDSEKTIELTNKTHLMVPVQPGTEHKADVFTCVAHICSGSSPALDYAFASLLNPPFIFLRKTAEAIDGFDLIGKPISAVNYLGVPFTMDTRKPLTIDNTTLSVFYASTQDSSVVRSPLSDLSETHSLAIFPNVRHIAALPSRSLLIVASNYQIVAYRFTGTFEHLFYSCAEATECGEVVGLSVDDTTGDMHYALLFTNGSTALYETDQEDRTSRLLATNPDMPQMRQLLVTHEKVVFLTTEGKVGYCDKHLQAVNVDYSIPVMDMILPLYPDQGTNVARFSGDVTLNPERKDQLWWSVEPRTVLGKSIFKITLSREKQGSEEKTMEITTRNQFNISSALLKAWDSAQKYDVSIEGLTAWTSFSINTTGLQTPVKPPSVPTNARLYATQQKTVDGARAIISFFWDAPEQWNGTPFQYNVTCTRDNDEGVQGGIVGSTTSYFSFAVKNGKISCQVAAANEPDNFGEYSKMVTIDSSELKPLVRLFAIDSTNDLMAITNLGNEDGHREKRDAPQMEYQAIAFIGNDLFAVRKEPDSIQPVLVQIDTNDISNVVHKISIGGELSRIEAMTSDWVANRLLFVSGMALYQLPLDPFLTTSLLTPKKLLDLTTGAADAKQLTFDPFKNFAYLLTRNGSLFSLDLTNSVEMNMALAVPCLSSQTVTWMMTEFQWNRASSPKIYALTWNGLIVVDLEEKSKCNEVRIDWNKFGEKGLKAMSAFAIADKLFVFVTSSEMLIYGRENVIPVPIKNPPLRQILAVSQSSQPFPDRSCFTLPSSAGIQYTIQNEGKTGAYLDVQAPPKTNQCMGVSFPQTHYDVFFNRRNSDKVKHIRSFNQNIHVENGILDKETDYDVTVAWFNRYSDVNGISDPKSFRTGFGYPSAPRELRVISVTPDTVFLFWLLPDTLNSPIDEIKYKISQQAAGLTSASSIAVQEYVDNMFSSVPSDTATCLNNPCRVKISNLRPSTDYKFWSTSIHKAHLNTQFLEDSEAVSQEVSTRTKDIPGTLRPDNVTGSSIILRWNNLEAEQPPMTIYVQYKESGNNFEWKTPSNASFSPNVSSILVVITNLLSATSYDYRFVAAYTGTYNFNGKEIPYREDYYQGVQQVKTKAGVPTSPLLVEAHRDDDGWIVSWQEPLSDGGSPITSYAVEMRHNSTAEWEIAERGLDGWKLWWRPPTKTVKKETKWEFRVRAANQEGFGPYTSSADNKTNQPESSGSYWWIIVLAVLLLLLLLFFLCTFITRLRRSRAILQKKLADDRNCITLEKMAGHHSPDQPLSSDMLHEMKNLPRLDADCVTRGLTLGRGSFGNVYKATAEKIPLSLEKEVVCAMKVLKDNFEERDRINFIKEAILMNNFDHPNIVRLLAVNLNKKPFLLLEYMEGGVLLDFLHNNSPNVTNSSLSLHELLGMIVDVARGCAYLESNRHVHRDIAARNCLISADFHGVRTTKIADFGLGRGIYNTPEAVGVDTPQLRWWAPESVINGTFTSKSDVWSFGLLVTEIMTFGEEPYHNLSNSHVLEMLRKEETPLPPPTCPDHIKMLLHCCWSTHPEDRYSFSMLLSKFEELRELPDYQENKPFLPMGCQYNEAFDASLDDTSSLGKPDSPRDKRQFSYSYGTPLNKSMTDCSKFDRSSASNRSSLKHARPSVRREKTKTSNAPSSEEIRERMADFEDFRTSDHEQRIASAPLAIPPTSPVFKVAPYGYEVPSSHRRSTLAVADDSFSNDKVALSRSWAGAGPSSDSVGSHLNLHPPSLPSSSGKNFVLPPPVRVRAPSASSNGPPPTYANRQGKVSQV